MQNFLTTEFIKKQIYCMCARVFAYARVRMESNTILLESNVRGVESKD